MHRLPRRCFVTACTTLPLLAGGDRLVYEHAKGLSLSAPIPTAGLRRLKLDWKERWTAPLTWNKHGGNPVLPAPATTPSLMFRDHEAMLFFGSRPRIGVATANRTDLTRWRVTNPEVLAFGPADSFDAAGVNAPEVVALTDRHWRMYYVGYHATAKENGAPVHQIGLAESEDGGRTWRRVSHKPVIPRGEAGSHDAFSASSASVLRVGKEWWLWYGGISQVPYLAGICLAISSDGVRFRKHDLNPVLPFNPHIPGEAFICAKPHVHFDGGVFRMWYTSRGYGAGTAPGDYRICYAESLDGVHWERYPRNPVVTPSSAGWDHTMVEYAEVVRDEDRYHMYYCGDRYQSIGYAEGRAHRVAVQTRTGSAPDSWGSWSAAHPAGAEIAADRYLQIRVVTDSGSPASVEALRVLGEPE